MTNLNVNLSIGNVLDNYTNGVYSNKETYPEGRILPKTHVFDETLSVAANIGLVESHNAGLKSAREAYRNHSDELNHLLQNDCAKALAYSYDLTEEQAEIINAHAYRENHSSLFDYIQSLYDLGEIAKSIVNALPAKKATDVSQSVQNIITNYTNGVYTNNEPYPEGRVLKETHVFNENLSVAENRQLVEEHNSSLKSLKDAYREQTRYLYTLLSADCKNALMFEYGLNSSQAEVVNEFAYREYHSSTFDYIQSLQDLGELAESLVKTTR